MVVVETYRGNKESARKILQKKTQRNEKWRERVKHRKERKS